MMRISVTNRLCLLCLMLGLPHAGAAPVIGDVRVENIGAYKIDETLVLTHVRARPGDELDSGRISRDIKSLLDTGLFSLAEARQIDEDGRLILVYRVKPKLRLKSPVRVEGCDRLDEDDIRDYLELEPGDLVDEQVMGIRARKVDEEYRDRHYPNVEIAWEITEVDPERGFAEVTVRIDENKKTGIRTLLFKGNRHVHAGDLRLAAGMPGWWNPMGWTARREYDPAWVESARGNILGLYRDRGFLNATVAMAEPEPDDDGYLIITCVIDEGEMYTVDRIDVEGNELFPADRLEKLAAMKPGYPASVRETHDAARRVEDYYGMHGYLGTIVRPRIVPDEQTGKAEVTLSIAEGSLTRVADVCIRGNAKTRDKVIRRELTIYPGDIYKDAEIQRSRRRMSNLGYFEWVRTYPAATARNDEKDVVFEVQEKPTGNFMMGFGFSSEEKVSGMMEISQSNFDLFGYPYITGGGQKIRFRAEYGTTKKRYEFSFEEPWFLDRRLALGFDLYNRSIEYDYYDVDRAGGSVGLGTPVAGSVRIGTRYTLERVSPIPDDNMYVALDYPGDIMSDTGLTAGGGALDMSEDRTVSSTLSFTIQHDTRDRPFFPTSGTYMLLSGRVSGGILGQDLDLYGLGLKGFEYVPLWYGHVFKLRAQYEIVEEYGDTDRVPYSERLFIGGGSTLRGFKYRDVGPKAREAGAISGYRSYGGRTFALASAEYTVPLVPGVRLATFYDIGNVWPDPYDFYLHDLASSWGIGLRFDIPHFPIRIDRAWTIEKDNELTEEEPWVFWITYE